MMPKEEIIRSTCGFCYSACGVLVTVTGGKVTKVAGDPESPVNRGRLCPKGLSAGEQLYHPRRLRHPLQRTGARGSGQWRKISWDQAFDHIAEAFQKTKEQYGPQGVVFVQGAAKGLIDSYHERLANAFGSPNFATSGHVCFLPRLFAAKTTCGFYPVPDYQGSPACILVWGANLAHTRHGEHFQTLEQLKKGSRLILIDPRVIAADFGWWFPEKGPEGLFGWAEANLNVLTGDSPPFNAEMGSSQFRGIPCRVYKAEE